LCTASLFPKVANATFMHVYVVMEFWMLTKRIFIDALEILASSAASFNLLNVVLFF
jgi:hypothetical protein